MSWRSSSRSYSSSYSSGGYGSSSSVMSSDPRAVDNSLRWIADEQKIHETSSFGENKKSVEESLADQKQRITLVKDYKGDVEKLKKVKDGAKVGEKYKTLDAVATSRLECLEGVSKIAGLEDLVNKLSSEFSIRASQLVEGSPKGEGETCDGIGAAAQNCILAVRANWSWISKLVHCTDIHLQNASDFHQFFHTAKEYEGWMASDLQKAQEKVLQQEEGRGDQKEASKLLLELKEILSTFLHWQGKIDNLFESSKKVVPVQLRTKPLDHYRPVTALCNYKTKEINLREGEEMTLTDNSNPEVWKVRTLSFDESDVPSVICLIPGPDADAVNLANKLRLQLLGIWTLNVKRIGKTLIWFMLLTVKNFDDKESKKLKAIPVVDKNEIGRMLGSIETTLGERWKEYDGYKELECRNTNMRRILSASGNKADHDPKMAADLKQKLEMVEELLKKYKDFWDYWETYKCLVETSGNPEYLLIVDAWQQLKFLELAQLKKQWPHGLKMDFTDEDNAAFNEWLSRHGGCIHERYDKVDGEKEITVVRDHSQKLKSTRDMLYGEQHEGSRSQTEGGKSSSGQVDEKVLWQTEMLFGNKKDKKDDSEVVDESSTKWSVSATDNPDFVQPPETVSMLYGSGMTGARGHSTGKDQKTEETVIVEKNQTLKSTTDGTDSSKGQGGSSSMTETVETITTTSNLSSDADGGGSAGAGSTGTGSAAAGESTESWSTEEVTETVETVTTENLQSGAYSNGFSSADTTMSRQYETAETEQVSHMEQEEKKTFVITGVFDPTSNEEVSMQKAVMLGIINSANGTYNNLKTGESMPIPAAMNAGLIKVEFTSTKRSEEKRRDIGLITIKTHKESRPYTVKAVIDAKTDKQLSIDEAISKGILDQARGNYHNTLTDTDMSLADALDTGLLVVEFDDTVDVGEPEIVTRTYAIHAVVDQKARKKVSFTDAVRKNLLDRETGAYFHNVDNEDIYVGDAIRRGFIKATVVKDPSSLDIDPENKMVVEKVDNIRKKMLGPMKALSAMKKAADASGK